MVIIETAKIGEIELSIAEVVRYLGYGKNNPDNQVLKKIEDCICEMKEKLSLRACYERLSLCSNDCGKLSFGNIKTDSQSLRKNLSGCDEIVVFAATIGVGADRIIQRNSVTSPSSAVVAQAVGTAFVEKWCDVLCDRIERREKEEGRFLRPRFSPGYGDFPLEMQKDIFGMLDCPKAIGVSLTDSLLMVPSKSVSAIVGVSKTDTACHKQGCEVCEKTDCGFRRC